MGYLNLVGSFVYKEPLFRSKLDALAENDAQLKTDGWAASSKVVFYQAAVPTGWTQDTSQNDKALRVVGSTGGGGSGGTQALSTAIPLAHTHAIPSDDGHTHAYAAHTHNFGTDGYSAFDNGRGSPGMFYINNGGSFTRCSYVYGGGAITSITPEMASPGGVTLGSLAAHDHGGTTVPQLTDISLAYCDVIVGTKNALAGAYTDLTTYWHTGDKADFDPFAQYAANDAYCYGALMPTGSVTLVAMDAAPSGWTKVNGPDDRFLRIVSGTGAGIGGTQLVSLNIPLAHTHALPATSDHTHNIPAHGHSIPNGSSTTGSVIGGPPSYVQDIGGQLVRSSDSGPTASRTIYKPYSVPSGGTTSAAGGHTHDVPTALSDVAFAYVDVIQCSKDSTGAPYAYTDYTSEFAWKKLISYQRLNALAKNDSYIQYHTTPTSTGMLFFMSSPPTGWIKQTAQHDMALRIVSGSTGGMAGGGAHLMSELIPLAHTHPISPAGGHMHDATHIHALDTGTVTANPPAAVNVRGRSVGGVSSVASDIPWMGLPSQPSYYPLANVSGNPNETPVADPDHTHTGVTDSKLTDVSLAYADVIWCTKS